MADTPLQRNGTATAPMSCEEAQLHKERLQALAEKRKRQTEIEDKRSQLDNLVLQVQHLKSKATRERWLLQGIGAEEEEVRRKQLEQDEEHSKKLEDVIHRLEFEIGSLESEESQISAKEQVLRARLKETERSIEDLQKSLMTHDKDASGCISAPLSDCTEPDPDHVALAAQPRTGPPDIPRPGCDQTGVTVTTANGYEAPMSTRHPSTAMKLWQAVDDVSDAAPKERALKCVSFQESVSIITDGPASMEVESQQIQHGCLSSPSNRAHNAGAPDGDGLQEIRYLDQVLDAASETPTNGSASPSEHTEAISVHGSSPAVSVSASSPANHQSVAVEGRGQTTFVHREDSASRTNGHGQAEESGSGRAKFELRAFQEERRPAKLFVPGEEQEVRVTRRRPSGEVQELERERQELIKDQAVKKNPGIAHRWWNPPQEVPLEEQLDSDQLESLKKYQERKQQRQSHTYTYTQPQVSGPPTMVTFDPELIRKEEILEEQINFSSARKQFLQGEETKRDVAPHMCSTQPFSKSVTRGSQGGGDVVPETAEGHVTWSDEGVAAEFTCARAVMTILPDEEERKGHFYHPEETDSGLDELSVRSQDTTMFSSDNISDSGASLPPTPSPLTPVSPPTPQPSTPVNGQSGGSPTEDELEYHAGVLVQSAIQNALEAQDGGEWRGSNSSQLSAPLSPSSTSTSSPEPVSSSPVSSGGAPSLQSPVSSSPAPAEPSPQADGGPGGRVLSREQQQQPPSPAREPRLQTPSPPSSQPVSPPQRPRDRGPRIKIQSSYARALASSAPSPARPPASSSAAAVPRPAPVCRPPSPPSPEKPEFSYFSKYSEAAELRSTAARGPEAEAASGPFRLRSKKQRTLSMIEEEIRAAQQREEELKKQREGKPVVAVRPSDSSGNSLGPARTGMRQANVSPADKMKSNSLPARLTLTARTAPGKIEKVRPAPPVSPSPSEGALSDAGSEDSGGRPKSFMQTLMEDYETHKVKRREKLEDNSVLEATRVTRRKSDMARKWEAGIYANEDGEEEDQEEEEEEEEEE